jgi:hypothetical protein
MSIFDEIIAVYPELESKDFDPNWGTILLRDDSDGRGAYIEKWEYTEPLPEGMTIGKPKK